MVSDYWQEDTVLTFRDFSYDEEAAKPIDHKNQSHYNLLMKNTLIYVVHPKTKMSETFDSLTKSLFYGMN